MNQCGVQGKGRRKMIVINLEDLKNYRARRIASNDCNFDEMVALGGFIERAEKMETKEIKYFDEDEKVWTIGNVIVKGEH